MITGGSRTNLVGGGPIPQEGRLEGTSVPEILWALARQQHTGALVVDCKGYRKVLYLRDGKLVFAASTDPEDRLGAFLLRRGEIALKNLLVASPKVTFGRRLGQILVDMGALDEAALVRAVRDQVQDITLSVFNWKEGVWRVSRACLPIDESIRLDQETADLILTGVRKIEDWSWVRRKIGTRRTVYRTVSGAENREDLHLGMTERAILEFLARPCRVEALCRSGIAPVFDLCRLLIGLDLLGLVERYRPSVDGEVGFSPGEGSLECGGAADLLLRLGDRGFSGAVRLFREEKEGCLFLNKGRITFVCQSDNQWIAFSRLNQVKTPEGNQAAFCCLGGLEGHGLLGGGEAGDTLRSSHEESLRMARNLVFWNEGEFLLEEGTGCPAGPVIDLSVEELIATSWDQVESWNRVWSRLGRQDTVFRLRPDYLDRLDRMTLWPALWDLVAVLREPASLQDILALRPGGDFETCRLLCALEDIKVIERTVMESVSPGRVEHPSGAGLEPLPPSYSETLTAEPSPMVQPADTARDLAPELFPAKEETAGPPEWMAPPEPGEPPESAEEPVALFEEEGLQQVEEEVPPEPGPVSTVDFGALLEQSETTEGSREWWSELNEPNGSLGSPILAADQSGENLVELNLEPEDEPIELPEAQPLASEEPGPVTLEAAALEMAAEDEAVPDSSTETKAEAEPEPEPEPEQELIQEPAREEAQETTTQAEVEHPLESGPVSEPVAQELQPTRPVTEEEPEPELEIPEELLAKVQRFNRRHAVVFMHLRQEMGAGARNLVLACIRRLGSEGVVFEGMAPDREGQFETLTLAGKILRRGSDPEHMEALIQAEIGLIRDLVSSTRLEAIVRGLAAESY